MWERRSASPRRCSRKRAMASGLGQPAETRYGLAHTERCVPSLALARPIQRWSADSRSTS